MRKSSIPPRSASETQIWSRRRPLLAAIRPEAAPLLYIACGSDDPSIDDTREFLSLLASRSIPYEYRELSPVGRGWALWDGQIMEFVDVLARRWGHDAEESQR